MESTNKKDLTSFQEFKEKHYPTGSPEREQYEKELEKELILKYNKILAIYLGYEYLPYKDGIQQPKGWWLIDRPKVVHPKTHYQYFLCRTHSELRFFTDWNLLMRVWNKIESEIDDIEKEDIFEKAGELRNYAAVDLVSGNKDLFFYSLVEVVEYINSKK